MKVRVPVAVVIGVTVGYAFGVGGHREQALGQQATAWEYKVVQFEAQGIYATTESNLTKQLNTLASVGWEYVGPRANWQPNPGTASTGPNRSVSGFVAFKRPKR
jgi:hypothetical protein